MLNVMNVICEHIPGAVTAYYSRRRRRAVIDGRDIIYFRYTHTHTAHTHDTHTQTQSQNIHKLSCLIETVFHVYETGNGFCLFEL